MGRIHFPRFFARKVSRLELLVGILIVVCIVSAVVSTVGSVPLEGSSMEPTASDGQKVIVVWAAYWFGEPQRGDVVTFQYPLDPERYLIKRVIGLPGEWVEVTRDHVYINGSPLEEPYIQGFNSPTYPRTLVGKGSYFVMGDNRNRSTDSRVWGMLPRENITGRAWLVYWPLGDWHLIRGYSYETDQD